MLPSTLAAPQLLDCRLSYIKSIECELFPSALAEVVARRKAREKGANAKADNHFEALSTLRFRRQERQASSLG